MVTLAPAKLSPLGVANQIGQSDLNSDDEFRFRLNDDSGLD